MSEDEYQEDSQQQSDDDSVVSDEPTAPKGKSQAAYQRGMQARLAHTARAAGSTRERVVSIRLRQVARDQS